MPRMGARGDNLDDVDMLVATMRPRAMAQRIADLEAALRHIIGTAGHPNAAEGCRLIINRAKQALGEK